MLGAVSGLRILACSDNYPAPDAPMDGTFLAALLARLQALGATVDVIAPRPWLTRRGLAAPAPDEPHEHAPSVWRSRYLSLSNRRLAGVSTRRLGQRLFDRAVARAAAKLPRRPQVAYAHFLFQGGHGLLPVARRLGIPAVVALGESAPERYLEDFGESRVRRTLGGFDAVLAVSEANREWALGLGAAPERIELLPNAADTEHFRPLERSECRRALGLPPERPLVAFVGRLIERKGPLRLEAALRAVPEAGAIYLGEGPQRPTGEAVLHVGAVPHAELPRWLAAADLLALPSLAEGSPNVVAEALACGLPVVASDLAAVAALVDGECARLVPAGDAQALGRALAELLRDEAKRRRMGRAARRRAERFDLDARARRILERLESLCSLDPPSGDR